MNEIIKISFFYCSQALSRHKVISFLTQALRREVLAEQTMIIIILIMKSSGEHGLLLVLNQIQELKIAESVL